MTRIALALLLIIGVVACSAEADTETAVSEFVLEDVQDVFDTEEHLATPSRAYVRADGQLYVLDGTAHRVLVLSPEGELLHTIGREGEGPGEFSMPPSSLVASSDSVFVLDGMRPVIHAFAEDGTFSYTRDLGTGAAPWNASLTPDGHVVQSREGFGEHLAVWVTPEGEQTEFGELVAPNVEVYDMAAMKSEIAGGEVPAAFRNSVLPVLDGSDAVWLILHGEGVIRRYDADGALQLEVPLEAPEMERIRERFFESNAALDQPNRIIPLRYVTSAAVDDRRLWLLLNMPEEDPAVVLLLSEEGAVKHHFVLPEVSRPSHLTLSPDGSTLYLSIWDEARLLAVDLPEELAAR